MLSVSTETMNQNDAKKLVQSTLEGFTITEIEDFGDIFAIYFVNNKYYKSKDPKDLPAGGGPLIIIKNSQEIFTTGSALGAKQYVQAFRECGDIYGRVSNSIEIYELPKDKDKKHCILSLKKIIGKDLSESKKIVEEVTAGISVSVTLKDRWQLQEVHEKLVSSGFSVKYIWCKSC